MSEHAGFLLAYVISAAVCVALIGYYVAHVLGSVLRGAAFAVVLGAMYGVLYAILSAEDYALLMGSLVVFGVLAGIMVLTRKVDWAKFGQRSELGPRATGR